MMATKTSLIINSTYDGKTIQKTLTDINPAADNTALKTWGQMLNGLTTNTYVKTDRIDKTNCDSVVEKLTPSLVIDSSESPLVRSEAVQGKYVKVNYTGDGTLSIVNNDETSWATTFRKNPNSGELYLYMGIIHSATEANATAPHDIVIRSDETNDYKAGEFTFTISEG